MATPALVPLIRTQYDAVERAVLQSTIINGNPVTNTDSPPGAGKTDLVATVSAVASMQYGMSVCCATPRASQSIDIARRLQARFAVTGLQLLISLHRSVPTDIEPGLVIRNPLYIRLGPGITVCTVDKLSIHLDAFCAGRFDLLILDESYQTPFKRFVPVTSIAPRILLVGDPGQLPPLVQVDTRDLEAAEHRSHRPVPSEVLRQYPDIPRFRLPATWRLPQDTVNYVQPHLYPDLPFTSAVDPMARQLRFTGRSRGTGISPCINRIVEMIEGGATMLAVVLPHRDCEVDELDDEISGMMASIVSGILRCRPHWVDTRPLGPCDIGAIDPHVQSGGSVRERLRSAGYHDVHVDTPEVWQGAQIPVTVVKHPLSIFRRPTEFELESGRWCVAISRHQHACIIVARENVTDVIRDYRHDCGATALGVDDRLWQGYLAHAGIWADLERRGRIIRC